MYKLESAVGSPLMSKHVFKNQPWLINTPITKLLIFGLTSFFLSTTILSSSYAEDVAYDGTDKSILRTDPTGGNLGRSLFSGNGTTTNLIGNTISVNDLTTDGSYETPGYIYGGISYLTSGTGNDVTNNSVAISGTGKAGSVYGGYSYLRTGNSGNATGNIVTISDNAQISRGVYGGYTFGRNAGFANENKVIISHSAIIGGDVYGGYSSTFYVSTGETSSNEVTISGNAKISGMVAGGGNTTQNGIANNALNNKVTISDDAVITSFVYGGFSQNTAGASGNTNNNIVTITGNAQLNKSVYGGYTEATRGLGGDSTNNTVTLNGTNAVISADVVGGRSYGTIAGQVTNNEVLISGQNTISGSVYGGNSYNYAYNGTSTQVASNKVSISGDTTVTGSVYGGMGTTSLNSSTPTTTTGSNITNNNVELSGKVNIKGDVYGGYSNAMSGFSGNATNNTITLNGENLNITGRIFGGFGNRSNTSSDFFTGNTLNLNGYRGSVWGIYNIENYNWILPKNVVNNDTIINITSRNNVDLNGTNHTIAMENDGNRLNVGDEVTLISNATGTPSSVPTQIEQGLFLIYDVEVTVDENNKFVLRIKDENSDSGGTDTGGTDTGGTDTGGTDTGGTDTGGTDTGGTDTGGTDTGGTDTGGTDTGGTDTGGTDTGGTDTGGTDTSGTNTGGTDTGGSSTTEETTEPEVTLPKPAGHINPRTKAFSEGRIAAMAFLNQGSDLIADYGIRAARSAIRQAAESGRPTSLIPFAIINGGSSRYKTGSHVDIDGVNAAIGLATGYEFKNTSLLTIGGFYEYGKASYDSYNYFSNYNTVHGDGNINYNGGGVLFRLDFANTGLNRVAKLDINAADGLYMEGSWRAGTIKYDFDTNDIFDGEGYRGTYNSRSNYQSAHIATGYVFNFNEKNSLDIYGRYSWSRLKGEDVKIGKDGLNFKTAESSRLRVGGRYNYHYSQQFQPFVGAAYEYEFKGDIAATAYKLQLDRPSLKGGTGIFELGLNWQPLHHNKDFIIEFVGQGFIGERRGGSGGIKIKYDF
ncbi:hypothetical protein [Bartonella sp. HY761]|uniref:hypothetical protein n=1 Tax=Bartonella sp. HY761 TaxID=2979330 RepID=UPI002204C428|nr:hypothetical protein [Bartonella sp. HY761]UXN05488.1 hypothetical protein N6A79_09250 [Bartonella sp. HY761]